MVRAGNDRNGMDATGNDIAGIARSEMIDSHIILTCRKYISSMDADFWKATALF